MASESDYWPRSWALLAAALTAVLVWFGTGLNPWWPLMWLAPLPVQIYATRSSWRSAALTSAVAWTAGGLNLWHYFTGVLEIPPVIGLAILIIPSLAFAATVLLFRALLRPGAYWIALLAFPAAWVSYEYLLALTSIHGTAGNLSYSQIRFLPFLQLASVTGPWGMSFLLLLFPVTLAIGLHLRNTAPKLAWRIVFVGLGTVVLALLFGAARLQSPAHGERVKVALIASDLPANADVAKQGAESTRLFRDYLGEVEKLAASGAKVIVLPEKLGVVVDPDTAVTDAVFQSLADKTSAKIIVGMVRVTSLKYNEARIYAPGVPPRTYDKVHMLPPFESSLTPGTVLTQLAEPSGIWGVEICKDMDFTPLSRQYGLAGTGLLLVPAWDFSLDRALHGHMAIMRGVESGFSIVRAAKQGYLTVSDNRGRIVAETRSDSSPFSTLVADVPATHVATLYLKLGDWFAWVAMAALLIALIKLFRLTREGKHLNMGSRVRSSAKKSGPPSA